MCHSYHSQQAHRALARSQANTATISHYCFYSAMSSHRSPKRGQVSMLGEGHINPVIKIVVWQTYVWLLFLLSFMSLTHISAVPAVSWNVSYFSYHLSQIFRLSLSNMVNLSSIPGIPPRSLSLSLYLSVVLVTGVNCQVWHIGGISYQVSCEDIVIKGKSYETHLRWWSVVVSHWSKHKSGDVG